ncbi:hypothetical protein [Sporosarcina sp. P16b]|uniref:hypothetical protein n=1 Tax=Sporosarcina sp. P16b TaxID=2048261 RepID=UPI0018EE3344|nr:hypothetical protein [Sporosarcina sp. P16b]
MEAIVLYLVGLFVLFIVIQVAVTKGINNSIIGEMFEKQYGKRDKGKGISELLEKEYGQTEDDDKI